MTRAATASTARPGVVSLTDDRDGDREDDPEPEPEDSLEEDAYAEIDPEIAEQVAEADSQDADDEVDVDDPAEEPDDADEPTTTGDRKTVGHVYCRALGAGAAISQDRMGSGVDDRSAVIDEYADLAKELDLDE